MADPGGESPSRRARAVDGRLRAPDHQQARERVRPIRRRLTVTRVTRTGPRRQAQFHCPTSGRIPRHNALTIARSITDPLQRARVLTAVAVADQLEQAETMARSITNPYAQAEALAAVAGALAEAGQHEQAVTIARSITDPHRQPRALAAVAKALMAWGDRRQARLVASAACAIG